MSIAARRIAAAIASLCGAACLAAGGASGCVSLPRHADVVHDRTVAAAPGADGGLPALTGMRDRAPAKGRSGAQGDAGADGRGAKADPGAAAGASAGDAGRAADSGAAVPAVDGAKDGRAEDRPAALPLSMVPSRGAARTRIVDSARRLLGVVRSFDERSFLGHVLIINDALPRGESSVAYTAAAHRARAQAAGAWVDAGQALPGDIVLFPCRSGCGAGAADGVAAGVVEQYAEGTLRFIAYVDGEVRACAWGGGGGDGVLRIGKVEGVSRTWP